MWRCGVSANLLDACERFNLQSHHVGEGGLMEDTTLIPRVAYHEDNVVADSSSKTEEEPRAILH